MIISNFYGYKISILLEKNLNKCFFAYKSQNDETKPLLIKVPKFRELKIFEDTKYMAFTLEDKHKNILVDKHDEIWSKVESLIKIKFWKWTK